MHRKNIKGIWIISIFVVFFLVFSVFNLSTSIYAWKISGEHLHNTWRVFENQKEWKRKLEEINLRKQYAGNIAGEASETVPIHSIAIVGSHAPGVKNKVYTENEDFKVIEQ